MPDGASKRQSFFEIRVSGVSVVCTALATFMVSGGYISGCGPLPPAGSGDSTLNGSDGVEPYAFPDDADPALAGLLFVETDLLVQPLPGAESGDLDELFESAGATDVEDLPDLGMKRLEVAPEVLLTSATLISQSELVEAVHKNYIVSVERVPDDTQFDSQDHLAQIGAPAAWDISIGTSDIRLAIVDTGVDSTHPDLADRVVEGWNVLTKTSNYADANGHGTEVAGVAAAASNNATGVAGVVWDCPILAVRVADPQGAATVANIASGVMWAVNHGANVINVSFAPLASNTVMKNAVIQAYLQGSLVFVSAGNSGKSLTAVDYAEGVFVGAVDGSDGLAVFSDRGSFVDLCAPGVGVLTTAINGQYLAPSGTSFASPVSAGVAALAWSANPALTNGQVRDALVETAMDLGSAGRDASFGWGRVDAAAAVALAVELEPEGDSTLPTASFSSPANGGTLSGKSQVQVTASDNLAVAQVVLSVDGTAAGTDKVSPYKFVINTASYSAGSHVLSAVATDAAGNSSTSATVSVTFAASSTGGASSGSAITFTSPANNSNVSGDTTIAASISDADGLSSVRWKVDGVSVFSAAVSGKSSSVSYRWRASLASTGSHTITVTVTDKKNNEVSKSLTLKKV